MDDLDLKIIEELRQDGRASNSTIARALGVSEGTVRRRLKRLVEDRAFEVRVTPNLNRPGGMARSVLGIHAAPDMVEQVLGRVAELDEVSYAVSAIGRYDVLAWVELEDRASLGRFIVEKVGVIPGVRRSETHVILDSPSPNPR